MKWMKCCPDRDFDNSYGFLWVGMVILISYLFPPALPVLRIIVVLNVIVFLIINFGVGYVKDTYDEDERRTWQMVLSLAIITSGVMWYIGSPELCIMWMFSGVLHTYHTFKYWRIRDIEYTYHDRMNKLKTHKEK
jgi:hypothetical protein